MLKKFKDFIIESSAAGNFERGSIAPFKYSNFYDYRTGYDKQTAQADLQHIFSHLESWADKDDFRNLLITHLGEFNLLKIDTLTNAQIEMLMKTVEEFLESLSDYSPQLMPDGSFLIFPEIKNKEGIFDIYYSPKHSEIRIVKHTEKPQGEETQSSIEDFDFEFYEISEDDFSNTIERLNKLKNQPAHTDLPDIPSLDAESDFNLDSEEETEEEEEKEEADEVIQQKDQNSGKGSLSSDDEYSL